MRKLMMAVGTVAGLSLLAGCQENRNKVAEEQRDVAEAQAKASEKVAEARQEASQEKAEVQRETNEELANANQNATETRRNAQQEMTEAEREAQDKVARAQQDIDAERKDVAEARQEQAEEARDGANETATGGSGMAAATPMTLTGTLKDVTMANNLQVIDSAGKERELKTNDQTKFMHNNKPVKMDRFGEGTQVRASYVKDGDELMAREVTVLKPVMKE